MRHVEAADGVEFVEPSARIIGAGKRSTAELDRQGA
jgi:hypothetical protein